MRWFDEMLLRMPRDLYIYWDLGAKRMKGESKEERTRVFKQDVLPTAGGSIWDKHSEECS